MTTPAPASTPPLRDHADAEVHEHDRGLSYDLPTLLSRRRALSLLGGFGVAGALAACASDAPSGTAAPTAGSTSASASASASAAASSSAPTSTEEIPEETAGPFPGDGSNGVNVLRESGIVRSDITASFGSSTTVAGGVPLTIRLSVLDTRNGAVGLEGAAVYLWHCDREGRTPRPRPAPSCGPRSWRFRRTPAT